MAKPESSYATLDDEWTVVEKYRRTKRTKLRGACLFKVVSLLLAGKSPCGAAPSHRWSYNLLQVRRVGEALRERPACF